MKDVARGAVRCSRGYTVRRIRHRPDTCPREPPRSIKRQALRESRAARRSWRHVQTTRAASAARRARFRSLPRPRSKWSNSRRHADHARMCEEALRLEPHRNVANCPSPQRGNWFFSCRYNGPAHLRRRASAQAVPNRASMSRLGREPNAGPPTDDDPNSNAAQYRTTGDSVWPECERRSRGAVRCSRRLYGPPREPRPHRMLMPARALE